LHRLLTEGVAATELLWSDIQTGYALVHRAAQRQKNVLQKSVGCCPVPFALTVSGIEQQRLCRFFGMFERTQQTLQTALVLVVVFPMGEVANMARALDVLRPTGGTGQYGVIDAERIQHIVGAFGFLAQGSFDFVGNPIAGYRVLREYQQQFIIQADAFIDAVADLIADVQVFGGKPAAHMVTLQVGVQACGKVFIATGIADKAGVVLNWIVDQRTNVGDKGIGQTCTTQEDFGYVSSRTDNCISSNSRRAKMMYCFKALYGAQVKVSKDSPSYSRLDKHRMTEVGTAEVGSYEASIHEVGTTEVGMAEVSSSEIGTDEVGSDKVGTDEVGSAEVGINEVNCIGRMCLSPYIPALDSLQERSTCS
jgi:hypothetical protein